MKIKELIKELKALNPESEVILQKDSEGNGYSPLSGIEAGVYVPESTWSGEFVDQDDSEYDDARQEPSSVLAVVLYPTN